METLLEKFGRFIISRRADGSNVELRRTPSEVVFLAFDANIKRLVELHVLSSSSKLSASDRSFVLETCKLATEVRGAGCMRVLEASEEEQTVFFSSNLSDGELAEDYVARRGALPQVTVFCLMLQFLEDLLGTPKFDQLVPHVSLANPLITTLEDCFLQLRIVDYRPETSLSDPLLEGGSRRVVSECCHLLFLLLTGQPFEGQNPDQVPALTCLPTNLRTSLRTALVDAEQASPYLDKLRDDVREAYSALVSNLQIRTSRRHIVVTEALQPRSQLKEMLLEQVPLAELLNGRFEIASGEEGSRHPFSIPAVNLKTDQTVTVHLLPPSGIVPRDQYEAVPLQMWRFNPERHPNILRSLSVWENPAWTFLTEEREPGFSLGRLMAERITLNPPEVLAILRQVRSGLDQAMECGVRSADLHPSNLLLKVGKGGPMQAREFERLMQKRIDAWPAFMVKLRTHMTMRSLYEPPLVELVDGGSDRDLHLAERELRHRAFLGLAVYLLTGERQAGKTPQFGEAVTESLALFLRSSFDRTPAPSDFVDAFELHMNHATGPEGRGIAAIMAASAATGGDTEDAGAISDFDEDWSDSSDETPAAPNYLVKGGAVRKSLSYSALPQHRQTVPGRMGMLLWAGSAVLLLLLVRFVLFGGSHSVATEPPHNATPPAIAVKASSDPVVAARFSSAPDVAHIAPGRPVSTTPPKELDKPAPVEKPASVTSPAQPVIAQQPPAAPAASKTAALTSPPPTPPANAPPVIGSPSPAQAPRDALETPITIKKAIVPSIKEVSDLKKESPGTVQHVEDKPPGVEVVDGAVRGPR